MVLINSAQALGLAHLLKKAVYSDSFLNNVNTDVALNTGFEKPLCGSLDFSSASLTLSPVPAVPDIHKNKLTATLEMKTVTLTQPKVQIGYEVNVQPDNYIKTIICDTPSILNFDDSCTVVGNRLQIDTYIKNHVALFDAFSSNGNKLIMKILINDQGCAKLRVNYDGDPTIATPNGDVPTSTSTGTSTNTFADDFGSNDTSLTKKLTYLYNIPLAIGAVAVLTTTLLEKNNIRPGNYHPSSRVLIPPPLAAQSPSIYDILRAVQFFVTAALLSVPCLENNQGSNFIYRNVASKLEWTCGILPSSIKAQFISTAADDKIRGGICRMTQSCVKQVSDQCKIMGYPALNNSNPPSSAYTDFGRAAHISAYNLFFMVLIIFCVVMAVAFAVALFSGVLAWLLKCLWGKWSILKTVAHNTHFLILGKWL
ncbi:9561_t:CDS:2 [Paraglomus occultum]|uniref:9561_t:CDS:1 n=1 Tax=Paraglomus occultum TaxID=144539 RepID=A0A9N8VVL8_9GLOM|nr:9561_t:CDS:2 [Paraglomus occultum]